MALSGDGHFGDPALWQLYNSAVCVIALVLLGGWCLVAVGLYSARRRSRWERRMRRQSENLRRLIR